MQFLATNWPTLVHIRPTLVQYFVTSFAIIVVVLS
jgi:hypothetical protein